jgi:hypothetical protein
MRKIDCPERDCTTSYNLLSNERLDTYGNVKSVGAMQRLGVATIGEAHPAHGTRTYYWKRAGIGWCEADTEAQRNEL